MTTKPIGETTTRAHILASMDSERYADFSERAAILEFCAHLPRQQAEAMALIMVRDKK